MVEPKMSKEDYLREMVEQRKKIVEIANSDGWKFIKHKGGVDCFYKRDDENPIVLIKGEGIVPATTKELLDFFLVYESLKISDKTYMGGEVIERIDDQHSIFLSRFKAPPLIKNRDFLYIEYDGKGDDGETYLCVAYSIERDDVPPDPNFVRGVIYATGYIYKPVEGDPSKSHLTYIVHVDPKGWLPVMVVNMVAADQAGNVASVKEHFEKLRGGASSSGSNKNEEETEKSTEKKGEGSEKLTITETEAGAGE
eukprot:TRINITY_DN8021_c0_g1_i2.p1 TRINITY_DN8021_c0_g1~~TRINITY_DN8021_c0_g1_i2.p1  ORF type:complete len:253 (-),score=61.70 TRINITY_DN8021_c0_g1_i2:127-885(-)